MYLSTERFLRAELDRHLHRDIEAAVHALSWDGGRYVWRDTPHPEGDAFDTEPTVELWTSGLPGQAVFVRAAQGPTRAMQVTVPVPQPPNALGYRTLDLAGGNWREGVELRQVPGDPHSRWLRVLRNEAPMRSELAAMALKIGAGVLMASLVCAGLAWTWVKRALSPLATLAERMRRLNTRLPSATSAGTPSKAPQAAEVVALAQEFDALLQRLAHSNMGLERFAADCAHALRTPLTALRLRGERHSGTLAPGPAREAMAGMLEEADRMSVLVQRLLLLARAVEPESPSGRAPLELMPLLHEVFDLMQPLADQRGVRLQAVTAGYSSAAAEADAAWLRQVLQDLIHNALEHAALPGQTVYGEVYWADGMAVIELRDSGPGMPAEVLSRLNMPPWPQATMPISAMRTDARRPIRSDHASCSGTGLGLAISWRLLAVQGGRLELLPNPSGGTCARCLLPAACTGARQAARSARAPCREQQSANRDT
jgi:signal transduction histidine kinase